MRGDEYMYILALHININQTYLPKLGAVSSLPEYSKSLSPTKDLICLTRSKSPVASTRKFILAKNNSHFQRSIKIKMHLIYISKKKCKYLTFQSNNVWMLSKYCSTLKRQIDLGTSRNVFCGGREKNMLY